MLDKNNEIILGQEEQQRNFGELRKCEFPWRCTV